MIILNSSYISSLLKQYLFWMLLFLFNRVVFLAYNFADLNEISFLEIVKTFFYGLYLDHSASSYLFSFGLIFITLGQIFQSKKLFQINKWITIFFLALDAIIISTELGLYDEWGVKLNYKAISHLAHPAEVFESATLMNYLVSFSIIIFQISIGVYLYNRLIYKNIIIQKVKYWIVFVVFWLSAFIIGTGVRGGLQPIPINQSDVYFSNVQILNVAAVNSCWNVIQSVLENMKYMDKNPYQYMDKVSAQNIVNELYKVSNDTTISILKVKKPNVVLIILESWASDMVYGIDSLHKDITPNFDSLANHGILFTNCYASGYRSDQGMAAILSGYPAQPMTSIIKQPSKIANLYSIKEEFTEANYHTSFHFGGQLTYGNIKGYLYDKEFDKIYDQADFPEDYPSGRLGVHDEFMFDKYVKDISTYPEPFFASAFTLSSHSPYDQPMKDEVFFEREQPYSNSVHYTDKSIKILMENAKKENWYDNTLFIFVADHSHMTPIYYPRNSWQHKKIPMLFYGEVLKNEFKGMKYDKVSCQTDLAKTLLKQLDFDASKLIWSKNLFNPNSPNFAYNSIEEGACMVYKDNKFCYDHLLKECSYQEFDKNANKDSLINIGKAHLQILYEDYLNH